MTSTGEIPHTIWDAIAITCKTTEMAQVIQEELRQLRKAGLFCRRTLLLAVEDARPNVGSGGATINALTAICEHLCAKEDRTVISFDVLLEKRFLIIHAGRCFAYEPLAGIFLRLPLLRYRRLAQFEVNNLHWLLAMLSEKIPCGSPPGVWICSGDMLLRLENTLDLPTNPQDIVAYSFLTDEATALRNGIYVADEDGFLRDILFRAGSAAILPHAAVSPNGSKMFPLVSGLLFFPLWAAEKLLHLYAQPPLDACTYLGVDSGDPAIEVSLFFDILVSMRSGGVEAAVHKEEEERRAALLVMRREMRGCRVRIAVIPGSCGFLSACPRATLQAVETLSLGPVPALFERSETTGINLTVGGLTFFQLALKEGHVWVTSCPKVGDELTIGRETWAAFSARTGLTREDVWPGGAAPTFESATLFPHAGPDGEPDLLLLRWLFEEGAREELRERFRSSPRLSLTAALEAVNPALQIALRRDAAITAAQERLVAVISACPSSEPTLCAQAVRPLLLWVACAGAGADLLRSLDTAAGKQKDAGRLARSLATIADLLAAMAGRNGGLRSGPAGNQKFAPALSALKEGAIARGLEFLREERCHWMGTPSQLIRVARHYERAAQTLIGQAVLTSKQLIAAVQDPNAVGKWSAVTVECPARIDLAGGWSDTPPLCYEHGGAVVNASISVNGKLPIGARVQRINEPHFVIRLPVGQVIISNAADLKDYDNPTSPGALVKATLAFAGLSPPLLRSDGSHFGLEVSTWAELPHGSGLGTSSILSAAVLAALWSMTGWRFSEADLVHGVLTVEQMMTTGGGWQDQIGGVGTTGLQIGISKPGLPLTVTHEPLSMPEGCIERLNARFVLLYTGKTRLAKNILQDVIRNWYARDALIAANVQDLVSNAHVCRSALLRGDLATVGECLGRYWEQKKVMAPGSEPLEARRLLDELQPMMEAQSLAGAGGGGFAVGLLKEGIERAALQQRIDTLKETRPELQLYECCLHVGGIRITPEI